MEVLPVEMLDLILDRCEHASLKRLRFVNKEFHDIPTPKVFEHVYMAMFDEHLEHLRLISQSVLAKHVCLRSQDTINHAMSCSSIDVPRHLLTPLSIGQNVHILY